MKHSYRYGLAELLGKMAYRAIGPHVANRQLERHLKVVGPMTSELSKADQEGGTRGWTVGDARTFHVGLYITDWWAVPWHNGSRSFRGGRYNRNDGKKVQFNVFFKNPADDPRLVDGGYRPKRAKDYRHLTKEEFYSNLRSGRLVVLRTSKRPWSPLTVPARQGKLFFTHGDHLAQLRQSLPGAVRDYTTAYVRAHLPPAVVNGKSVGGIGFRVGL